MPIKIWANKESFWISPLANNWEVIKVNDDVVSIVVDDNFYVGNLNIGVK